jgi:hypothetical protein
MSADTRCTTEDISFIYNAFFAGYFFSAIDGAGSSRPVSAVIIAHEQQRRTSDIRVQRRTAGIGTLVGLPKRGPVKGERPLAPKCPFFESPTGFRLPPETHSSREPEMKF